MHRILNEAMYIGALTTSLVVAASVYRWSPEGVLKALAVVSLGAALFVDAVSWHPVYHDERVKCLPWYLLWVELIGLSAGLLAIGAVANGRFDFNGSSDSTEHAAFQWMLVLIMVYFATAVVFRLLVILRYPDTPRPLWDSIGEAWGGPWKTCAPPPQPASGQLRSTRSRPPLLSGCSLGSDCVHLTQRAIPLCRAGKLPGNGLLSWHLSWSFLSSCT